MPERVSQLKIEHLYTVIYIAIFAGLFYLFYKVLSPFLVPIAWSAVMSITFYPVYKIMLKLTKQQWAASLITLLIILTIIICPFIYILNALRDEITIAYNTIEKEGIGIITKVQENPVFKTVVDKIGSYIGKEAVDLNGLAIKSLKTIGSHIAGHVSQLFTNVVAFVASFVIMCLTIYYFLKDGDKLAGYLKGLLPFSDEQKENLEVKIKEMVAAAIYGGVAVGIVQGVLGGAAFLVLGLSSPVLWGTAMAIFSLVPLFGTFIIWGPASIILILSGSYVKGIGLFLFGFLVIGMIDNVLKPLIIGGRTKLHTLLIFFSVLGGIEIFGFIGFILGPIIAVLYLSLLEIYKITPSEQ